MAGKRLQLEFGLFVCGLLLIVLSILLVPSTLLFADDPIGGGGQAGVREMQRATTTVRIATPWSVRR
jgi:hypothetical protein